MAILAEFIRLNEGKFVTTKKMIEVGNNFFSTFSDLDSKFLRGKIFICCFRFKDYLD